MTYFADISECGLYRYSLTRVWGPQDRHRVLWIMLNPSTADASKDDATIRRCAAFSKAWGFDGLQVVNLFALRATDPNQLRRHGSPVGERNDRAIVDALDECGQVICAWGCPGKYLNRNIAVCDLLCPVPLFCLGKTKDGHPKHPLYLPDSTQRIPFSQRGALV